jgi:hypothetical protein
MKAGLNMFLQIVRAPGLIDGGNHAEDNRYFGQKAKKHFNRRNPWTPAHGTGPCQYNRKNHLLPIP